MIWVVWPPSIYNIYLYVYGTLTGRGPGANQDFKRVREQRPDEVEGNEEDSGSSACGSTLEALALPCAT